MIQSIFVGSTGRAGTSILAEVISQIPQALYFRESRFLVDNDGLKGLLNKQISLNKYFNNMLNMYRLKTINNLKRDNFQNLTQVYSVQNVYKILKSGNVFNSARKFFELGMIYYNKSVLVEKTPHNITQAHIHALIFPKIKFIYIKRDPRDVFSSILTKAWGPKNPEAFILWYNKILDDANKSLRMIPKENILNVRFEELIENKYKKLKVIFDFLKLDYDQKYADRITEEKAHINRYKKDLSLKVSHKIITECN